MAWHIATLPSRLDPAFFSQHAHMSYNTICDRRLSEKPRKNQQENQTAGVGRVRTSGRRERGRSARGCQRRACGIHADCGLGRRGVRRTQ